ncbi:MAG TPA: bifunctional diaminohydroxyphosphoribosylaminopyrimidine deaminase/5-amino-6-(5-phosphoribosylamino)uracil reductase RibD [Firmicutes bacterium]|nr:bifunctional diaminohydroxyphosphoribosylaminopyrimidine deaminase/5-amino-6-(5-phosphoribosylamino)uracil reductase RibD [Bacillota bacterium]
MTDEAYMSLALELARRGEGWTAPNPMVGAVVVKDGQIIGQGWHQRCGQPHAERNALAACTASPQGATLYVTLEPCCHTGRQPPCTSAILETGIRRVVVGSSDPNPLVNGKGTALLRQAGVEVRQGVLREACDALNQVFFHYIRTGRPYVVMKYAMTLDGKIAAWTGAARWITGPAARDHVQRQRHRYTGIMVGVGTVLADDPLLTCRLPGGKNPVRVVCDSALRTPLTAQVVATASQIPTLIAAARDVPDKRQALEEAGCQVLLLPGADGRVDLTGLMDELGRRQIDSILLEGGGTLNWAALQSGIVQKVQAYLASKLLGGGQAKTPVEGQGFPHPDQAVVLGAPTVTRLGDDILLESEVAGSVHRTG